jgi:hypothetical protein
MDTPSDLGDQDQAAKSGSWSEVSLESQGVEVPTGARLCRPKVNKVSGHQLLYLLIQGVSSMVIAGATNLFFGYCTFSLFCSPKISHRHDFYLSSNPP